MTSPHSKSDKIRILFVCLGNICRSPLAEGVMRHVVREKGLQDTIEVDSCGTGHWHAGSPPDHRMHQTARESGVSLEGQSARQFCEADFTQFEYILTMDKDNLHDVLYLDSDEEHGGKVRLFREFDPEPGDYQVPDPYYGGRKGFESVYTMVERTCRSLLEHLIEKHNLLPRDFSGRLQSAGR